MGASFMRSWRWLWLAMPVVALAAALAAGQEARANMAEAAPANRVYLPHVSKPRPPQLALVPFASGFISDTITDITHAGDERLFVVTRQGLIYIVSPTGVVAPTPFLDLTTQVRHEDNWEQGLLGLAFHPDYPATPYFYVVYTTPGTLTVARLMVSAANPNLADAGSLRMMINLPKPKGTGGVPSPVHNAGDLAFGPDGYLYVPLGDGGPDPYDPIGEPGDPYNNAQRRESLFGSILRLDPNPGRGLKEDCGVNTNQPTYSIPADNPWLGDDGCDEVWAKGFRNPWRMSIDPLTGDFYFADVGEWRREEVSFYAGSEPGGGNFGWHCYEGSVDYVAIYPQLAEQCNSGTQYIFPVYEYSHAGGGCSVIGGVIYRGRQFPSLYGRYFFGDFCTREMKTMFRAGSRWQTEPAGTVGRAISTFGADVHGELYAGEFQLVEGPLTLFKVVVR